VDGDDHKFKGTTTHQSEYHWKKNNDFWWYLFTSF